MTAFPVRAAISARAACPALPKRRVGSGRRDSAAATEARAAAADDESDNITIVERGHVDLGTSAAFLATATTRRRLAVAVAAALALEPAIPRSSAGALTDLVKNSGVGGPNLGLVEFDSPDLDYSFFYPKGWKVLRNRLRRGVIVSDFDAPVGNPKVYVEVVSAPPAGELAGDAPVGGDAPGGDAPGGDESRKLAIRRRAVDALVAPVENDNSGDGKLEAPPMRLVKDLDFNGDPGSNGVSSRGFETYDYFTFTSETTTRSGYDVTRRHYAVAKTKGGLVYVLSASATTDGFDETRARLFERIVASFVVN
ncbi:predicted protein [Micromonas commoda]|uniref:PsbP C-terminal domain-containing protein n=1 Tax=Micromonas commoda (strain RCC299 / NOUM17 / CCMP2709) TaxID=296587 RepID=C1EJE0_MICCC|nr:predicted protein [Micromonas commoda]ACO68023.1 predicted protein [Micromonas commoda]|eukprot:XP_002506765.1 predicted protein [Micromonas commoda]